MHLVCVALHCRTIAALQRVCVVRVCILRVGQNHICTPYMTVYFVISLPETPCIHRIYRIDMVLANLMYVVCVHQVAVRHLTSIAVDLAYGIV